MRRSIPRRDSSQLKKEWPQRSFTITELSTVLSMTARATG